VFGISYKYIVFIVRYKGAYDIQIMLL